MSAVVEIAGHRIDPNGEQSRARYPDAEGYIERDGVRIFYERYGEGDETILLLPPWSFVQSRAWKLQIPYLARHYRVVTFDPRGNGKSDRPAGPAAYRLEEFVRDGLDVMDATGTDRASLIGWSRGAGRALAMAAADPERVERIVLAGSALEMTPWPLLDALQAGFEVRGQTARAVKGLTTLARVILRHPTMLRSSDLRAALERTGVREGAQRMGRQAWVEDYEGFIEWFQNLALPEPHSTKGIEDATGWALGTSPQILADTFVGEGFPDRETVMSWCERIECPMLVIHGRLDAICPHEWGAAFAAATNTRLITFESAGHAPPMRQPVRFNVAVRDFIEESQPRRDPVAHRSDDGRPRALFISSPIGLGHARRDVAIAGELRALKPDLQVDWLAQDPVTRVLEAEGESIHPASEHLASESGHFESESAEHDLHCFHSFRRMDEILCANFMVFHDVVREGRYDLVIGDEAWELDYYLHENPSEKRAPYVWLTDFVGFLPVSDADQRERFLTSDYNAQMIDHVDGLPGVRDQSIFVGNADDIVDQRLGPDLPWIRDWTERHFDFAGYITGFEPVRDRAALRAELGYLPDELVCIVTVGGSGVGAPLLNRIIASHEIAKQAIPALRMIVVAGPRIDPSSVSQQAGLEIRPYVHDLYKHLAACDLAVVQGGLTTAMELTANRRPFLYFPLKHHFEQQLHVHHRLQRHGAGRRMEYDSATPATIAEAITEEIGREVSYREVETDGARRAAQRIAELI